MEKDFQEEIKKIDSIYRALIKKAIENKWVPKGDIGITFDWSYENGFFNIKVPQWDFELGRLVDTVFSCSCSDIIFRHDFAMAIWGNEQKEFSLPTISGNNTVILPAWQGHLMEVVLSKNQSEYFSNFV